MTVELQTGSIFDAGADAIVIPVNCVGVYRDTIRYAVERFRFGCGWMTSLEVRFDHESDIVCELDDEHLLIETTRWFKPTRIDLLCGLYTGIEHVETRVL